MLFLTKDLGNQILKADNEFFDRLAKSINSVDELGDKDNALLRMIKDDSRDYGYYVERYVCGVEFIPGAVKSDDGETYSVREYRTRHSIKVEKLYLPRIFLDYFVGNIKQAYILTQFQDYANKLVDSYDVN